MTDFQDFLKREYAYVAIGEFKPGKFAEAEQLYEEATATYADGFKGAYLLQEPGTDRGISIVLWESEDAMDADKGEVYEAILKKMAPLFAHTPTTVAYEVVYSARPKPED